MQNKIKKSELLIFTKTKDLIKYIFQILEKSPKKFRFSIISRMQNISLEIIEDMYIANEMFVERNDKSGMKKKISRKREVITKLKILDYISEVAKDQNCILPKQYILISEQISECKNLTGAWIRGDKKILEEMEQM